MGKFNTESLVRLTDLELVKRYGDWVSRITGLAIARQIKRHNQEQAAMRGARRGAGSPARQAAGNIVITEQNLADSMTQEELKYYQDLQEEILVRMG